MKPWSKRTASLMLVAGLSLAAHGCGEDAASGSEAGSTVPTSREALPTTGASGGSPGASARAGSGGTPSTAAGSGATSTQAGTAAQSGTAAGSGGSTPAPAGAATFSAIYAEILTKGATGNCMFAACHGGEPDPAVNGGLQIKAGDKAGAYKNLVNAKSPGMVCSGKTYVIPGDSAGSLLVQKLSDTPPCGAKMPIGSPLTAAQVAQIAQWIDDGAENN